MSRVFAKRCPPTNECAPRPKPRYCAARPVAEVVAATPRPCRAKLLISYCCQPREAEPLDGFEVQIGHEIVLRQRHPAARTCTCSGVFSSRSSMYSERWPAPRSMAVSSVARNDSARLMREAEHEIEVRARPAGYRVTHRLERLRAVVDAADHRSSSSWNDCTPTEIRFTPRSRQAATASGADILRIRLHRDLGVRCDVEVRARTASNNRVEIRQARPGRRPPAEIHGSR